MSAGEVCQHTVTTSDGRKLVCGQVHDPKKCTGHKSIRDPETRELLDIMPCGKYPRKGLKVCDSHGGKAAQNVAKAAERVAAEQAERRIGRPPDPAVAERRAEALRMRRDGASYEDIAATLGYNSVNTVVSDVHRGLAVIVSEPAEELRALELQRLDAMWRAAFEVLVREHVTVSNGRVVTLDGVTIKDDGPVLQAIATMLRIMERRAKLAGLDAPKQVEVITVDAIDAEIRRLEAELAEQERAAELDGGDTGEAPAAEGAAPAEG